MVTVACVSCQQPVPLSVEQCPECGANRPTQAALHLAAGIRFAQDGRWRRALCELAAAQELAADLPGLKEQLDAVRRTFDKVVAAQPARFVTAENQVVEQLPWGPHDWLVRPDVVEAEDLLLVRVHMPPGQAHRFHRHPEMEEVIYVLEGTAEQWVEKEKRMLEAGQTAHIPRDVVHGTYNAGPTTLRFLAILSPGKITGPPLVDVHEQEPWRSLRH